MDIFEKNAWNDAWNKVLNRLGIRKVPGGTVNYLGNVLENLENAVAVAGATTAAMTLYVDAATGLDTNTGLVGFPLKTIQAAIDRVPQTIKHNVTINVGAGTYAENVYISYNFLVGATVPLTISGTLEQFTPATGAASGTFTSNDANYTFTLAAAGWTVDNLKGKFVKITSGAKTGKFYPIANNTATTINIGGDVSVIGNANFEFWYPTAIITKGSNGGNSIYNTSTTPRTPSSATILFKYMNLGSGTANGAIVNAYSGISIDTCVLSKGWANYSSFTSNMTNCYVSAAYAYSSNANNVLWVTDCAIEGNGVGAGFGCFYCNGIINIVGAVLVQGYTGSANLCSAVLPQEPKCAVFLNGKFYVKDCGYAIKTTDVEVTVLGTPSTGNLIVQNSIYDGIRTVSPGTVKIGGGIKVIITGSASDAIHLEGTGSDIDLESTSSITGNTGFGIKLPAGNVSHNNVFIKSTVTMNTNALGDLTLDGTTAISIADLRADPDKTVVDLIRLNRIAAD